MFFTLIDRALSKIHHGRLHLDFGNLQRTYGNGLDELEAAITVHDPTFFRDVALRGEMGLGESYVAQKWSSKNLPNLALVLQLNVDVFRPVMTGGTFVPFPKALFEWLYRRARRA